VCPLLTEERDGFSFRSGHPALDLTSTVTGRLRSNPRDLLATPECLDRWLRAAGAAPEADAGGEDLRTARSLREALYRLARARLQGEALPPADLELVNRLAAEPEPVPQLTPDGLRWLGGGVRARLAAVARAAVELLGGEMGDRIRECGGDGCGILFVDASRARDRRWCSMAVCGNRAKVAEFRRRKRQSRAEREGAALPGAAPIAMETGGRGSEDRAGVQGDERGHPQDDPAGEEVVRVPQHLELPREHGAHAVQVPRHDLVHPLGIHDHLGDLAPE